MIAALNRNTGFASILLVVFLSAPLVFPLFSGTQNDSVAIENPLEDNQSKEKNEDHQENELKEFILGDIQKILGLVTFNPLSNISKDKLRCCFIPEVSSPPPEIQLV